MFKVAKQTILSQSKKQCKQKTEDFLLNSDRYTEVAETDHKALIKKFDRRNFRKKMLSLDLIVDTNKSDKFEGNKPAKVYEFKKKIEDKEIF